MAFYGLAKPYIAKLKADETYTGGFRCGKAVETEVVPEYAEGDFSADNQIAEAISEFLKANVTLGVSSLPIDAANTIFGHTVDAAKITYKNTDESNYVGYGFIVREIIGGVTTHTATVLYKVKFTEQGVSYKTKGKSIEFITPKLKGVAITLEDGTWQDVENFATEAEAEAFIKTALDITE